MGQSRAADVVRVLREHKRVQPPLGRLRVSDAGTESVNGEYCERDPKVVPVGFALTCSEMKWDPEAMWKQLSDQKSPWYEAFNGAYVYWNLNDSQWWVDAPDGKGVYIVKAANFAVPAEGWSALPGASPTLPTVESYKTSGFDDT